MAQKNSDKPLKEDVILEAARHCFLNEGYSNTSMDALAAQAKVSVKTVYSHFGNKEQLFQAIMVSACADDGLFTKARSHEELALKFAWYKDKSVKGLEQAGILYLQHLLSADHLALYRVVTAESARFPELGRLYDENIASGRTKLLTAYLQSMTAEGGLSADRSHADALIYEGMLRSSIFERALNRIHIPSDLEIKKHAKSMAGAFWQLHNLPKTVI
ncbi:MAG: TetR/AcrR family transcriptional regulator [Candidatus Obscuribacterales bacterium]|nr:TetR/AcrR family transcriptional regulator [Candidatus Obscuribacterales bacterium]